MNNNRQIQTVPAVYVLAEEHQQLKENIKEWKSYLEVLLITLNYEIQYSGLTLQEQEALTKDLISICMQMHMSSI